MEKADFLKRCETIWDMGLVNEDRMRLMSNWLDFVLRYEATMLSYGQTQGRYCTMFLEAAERRHEDCGYLANDGDGYSLIRLAAILSHPCQQCAEDPNAWHTRSAFCEHKERTVAG